MCVYVYAAVWPMGDEWRVKAYYYYFRAYVCALIMPAPHRCLPPHWRWIENDRGKKPNPFSSLDGICTKDPTYHACAVPRKAVASSSNRNTHTHTLTRLYNIINILFVKRPNYQYIPTLNLPAQYYYCYHIYIYIYRLQQVYNTSHRFEI